MGEQIKYFEDVLAWQKAKVLTLGIYRLFRDSKDYSFRDQIQRASVSVMNNIAEGFERKSNKELKQYLFIAKGSCGEVRSMIRLAEGLRYISPVQATETIKTSIEVSKMLSGFIKSL